MRYPVDTSGPMERHRISLRGWFVSVLVATVGFGGSLHAQDDTVTYEVTFRGNWTLESTPGGVVGGAHFTTLIGAVHNSSVSFWSVGGTASTGVERMAELGITSTLRSEIEASTHYHAVIQESVSGGGTGSATFDLEIPDTHPLVTLSSMIGPSPDWFVGISGRSLQNPQGEWLTRLEIDLFPYDAGTEDGDGFSLSNDATSPQGVITSIKGTGKFSDEPMAYLTFVLDTSGQPPGRVTGVGVAPRVGELAVSWNAVSEADGYKVQWRTSGQAFDTSRQRTVSSGSTTRDTIPNLTAGTRYYVRVIATKSGADDGTASAEANGVPRASAPGRVTGVRVTAEVEQITVSWNAVADATGYKVQWRSGNQSFGATRQVVVTSGSSTRTTLTGLAGGTLYSVRVIATRAFADDGPPSTVATGTPRTRSRPPEASGQIGMRFLEIGETAQIDLADYFRHPESRALTFEATSDEAGIATVRTQGDVLTLRGVATGAASITVTARDSIGLTAEQRFDVMVGRVAFFATTSAAIPESGTARLTVRLSRPRTATTTLNWILGVDDDPDTPDADLQDHGGGNGSVVIPANRTDAIIELPSHDDNDIEPAREVFTVTLSAPAEHANDLALGRTTATVTINEGVCDRTPEVRDTLRGTDVCSAVSIEDLTGRTSLTLADQQVDSLQSLDFLGLGGLTALDISNNNLETLPSGLFLGLENLLNLRVDGNALAELDADVFGNLLALQRLRLDNNSLTELPGGLFHGVAHLVELQLQDNPGAPFALTVELERQDGNNAASGPATVVAKVAHGAPFAMSAAVSATNGELSLATQTVSPGAIFGSSTTVTQTVDGKTSVMLDEPPALPTSVCGDDSHPCFRGLTTAVGETLTLFTKVLPSNTPPTPELLADGDATNIDLSSLFSGEGVPFTYAAQSSDDSLLTVEVDDADLVLLPNDEGEDGEATVTVTATDAGGATATLSIVVTIDPRPSGFLRGWRNALIPRGS